MEQIRNLGDERQTAFCCFCGSNTDTRDHIPPKVFLDIPYPKNLPVVGACQECNQGSSLDEEYAACLIECARFGVTELKSLEREKVRRILERKPALLNKLEQSRTVIGNAIAFKFDYGRLRNVLAKLARGHAVYELNEPHLDEPEKLTFGTLSELSELERQLFEVLSAPTIFPEVGSRAMQRMIVVGNQAYIDWIDVQEGRYRYLISAERKVNVRICLSECLWCEATW